MTRRRPHRRRLLRFVLLIVAVLMAAPATPCALAVEMPSGTKNFTPPRQVPNYFSNESGSFNGGAGVRSAPAFAAPSQAAPRYTGERRHAAVQRRMQYVSPRNRARLARRGRVVLRQVAFHRAQPHGRARPAGRSAASRRVARAGR